MAKLNFFYSEQLNVLKLFHCNAVTWNLLHVDFQDKNLSEKLFGQNGVL
jgi:hypothetical protein